MGGEDLSVLAAEQVARGAAPDEVFAAFPEEVGRLLSVDYVHMGRYEPDDTYTVVASWGKPGPAVSRTTLGGKNLETIVGAGKAPVVTFDLNRFQAYSTIRRPAPVFSATTNRSHSSTTRTRDSVT